MAEPQVYTVPDSLLFRNFEVLSRGTTQTRNVLLQNKSGSALKAYVSYPFTQHFGLHVAGAADDGPQHLVSTPPHVALTVQPGAPCKVMVELRPPDDDTLNYVQDALVIVMGDVGSLVPIRAVRQSLDPFGGAQLMSLIQDLPFWPASDELRAQADAYMAALNQHLGMSVTLPSTQPSGSGSNGRQQQQQQQPDQAQREHDASSSTQPGDASGAASVAAGASAGAQPTATRPSPAQRRGTKKTPKAGTPSLPPESFSVGAPPGPGGNSVDTGDEPIVIKRAVVVNGRAAVVSGSSGPVGSGTTRNGHHVDGDPPREGTGALEEATSAGVPRPPSGSVAFLLSDGHFDARGRDITSAVAASPAAWLVVDCRRGSRHAGGADTAAASTRASVPRRPTSCTSSDDSAHAGAGASAQAACSGHGHGTVRSQASGQRERAAGSSRGRADNDELRTAALKAALEELGLTDLPPPDIASRPSTCGSAGAAGGVGAAPSSVAGRPSPPDMRLLRPRSGSFAPARLPSGGAGAPLLGSSRLAHGGVVDDGDEDLAGDFEARLQRNIDLNMPAASAGSHSHAGAGGGGHGHGALAPLAPLTGRAASGGVRRGTPDRPLPGVRVAGSTMQSAYGDDTATGDELQRHIDSQLGTGALPGAKKASPARSGGPAHAGGRGRGGAGSTDSLVSAARRGIPDMTASAVRSVNSSMPPAPPAAHAPASSSPARGTPAKAKERSVVPPTGATPTRSPPKTLASKPTAQQLSAQQAAWDAL